MHDALDSNNSYNLCQQLFTCELPHDDDDGPQRTIEVWMGVHHLHT